MNDQGNITINGNAFTFEPGETILSVAARNHIDIPTLCHLKGASPTGNCRICVVEIEQETDLLPACATPAEAGMVVLSESQRVVQARRMIIQLMLSTGNHNCAIRGTSSDDWAQFQMRSSSTTTARSSARSGGTAACRIWPIGIRWNPGDFQMQARPIPWKRSTRLSSGIFRDASSAAGVCRPATISRSTMPSSSVTRAAIPKLWPPMTSP